MSSDRYSGTGLSPLYFRLLLGALIVIVGAGLLIVQGCQRGPFGRRQLVALNADQEKTLGKQAFQQVTGKAAVIKSGAVVKAVNDVAGRLITATKNKEFLAAVREHDQPMEWEVEVVNSKEVNAFCLPGGKVVVYTAILPICETDAGLATVLGHEIAHALAHHGAERLAQQKIVHIGIEAVNVTVGDMDPLQRKQVLQALNAGAQFGILKYSRTHESEADHMGLLLMAAAGYDPHEAVKFWTRMQKATGGAKTPVFLSTHPSHETRIRDLERWMPEAVKLYKASGRTDKPHPLPALTTLPALK